MALFKTITLLCLLVVSVLAIKGEIRKFPDTLSFGVATAAYQIEGAWNASDKGESIWDRFTHTTNSIKDKSNGDFACDSYNQHKRDVEMVKELGVDFYRFSISWSRILPNGFSNKISQDGIAYYDSLIDDLLEANIKPYITLYHWDLPQSLQDLGGWTNPMMVDYFTDFAEVAFEAFGDRVKTWITFNEPWVVCIEGYGGISKAPALGMNGIAEYICAHNILKSHAKAYHLYDDLYRSTQKGRIGWSLNANWDHPATKSPADIEAAERAIQMNLGWFAHPVFSKEGDYPQVMKDRVARNSLAQGYRRSRLPEFTPEEIAYIKGTCDFFGLNHYTSTMIRSLTTTISMEPNFRDDVDTDCFYDPSWPEATSSWLKVVPWGFRNLLNWITKTYNNPEIMVFENGFSDKNNKDDVDRISYYNQYLNALLDAIEDGCNVTAYTAWSLMDNFEWLQGYTERFGLYYVDFNDPRRPRTPKASALYFKSILETRTIERNCNAQLNRNGTG
ncbi:myrosinase 1-like [Arctopsyche grandis]|uniref:myrosinase 1-like n=1 Tax=Arctopsyche grandis TaxID=121162 RepID=UPI00406D80B2